MYIIEWLEGHELFKRVFDTYIEAEDFAYILMQSNLVVVSLYQAF